MQWDDPTAPLLGNAVRQFENGAYATRWVGDHGPGEAGDLSRSVLTQHYAMLHRNLLYTGVARGKQLVVLVGQKKAVAIAVRNASGRRRWSKLSEWLSGTAPKRG
jgi:hypothetical protein